MLYKRLVRSYLYQGPGSNYRKLTSEEKQEAEKNFYKAIQKKEGTFPKIRNMSNYIKDLIQNARIPSPKMIPFQYKIHNDIYVDNYQWMLEEINFQELTYYLIDEFMYTDAVLARTWLSDKEVFKELKQRKPVVKDQTVAKAGCNN